MVIDPEYMCRQDRGDLEATYVKEPGKTCPTEILEALAAHNAEGRPLWKPMHMQPMYSENGFVTREGAVEGIDVSADLFARGLCLPSDNKMTREEQMRVIEIVRALFE